MLIKSLSRNHYLTGSSLFDSKLYRSHSPTALKLSHRTLSSGSCISSMTLPLRPNFSSCCRLSGTSFTKHATSLQPIAKTCLSFSQFLDRISASLRGSSPLFSSRMRRAFSCQKVGLRWGGDQRRWPELSSAAYSSKVVCVLVYSSSSSVSAWRSSTASSSDRWRDLRLVRRAGRRARTAVGSRVLRFVTKRFRRVERRRRVVFSLGEILSSCVYRITMSCSLDDVSGRIRSLGRHSTLEDRCQRARPRN